MVSIWDHFYIVAIVHVLPCCSSGLCCSRFFYQSSRSVMSNSLCPHGLQHARLPCPSPTPGACSNSCPLSLWCHPTISSSVVPSSSCFQSFPAPGSFLMSQLFASGVKVLEFLLQHQSLPFRNTSQKHCRGRNTHNLILWVYHHLDIKIRQI